MVKDTGHLVISDAYALNPALRATEPLKNRDEFLAKALVYEQYSVAFFGRYLKSDRSGDSVLHRPTSSYVASLDHQDR